MKRYESKFNSYLEAKMTQRQYDKSLIDIIMDYSGDFEANDIYNIIDDIGNTAKYSFPYELQYLMDNKKLNQKQAIEHLKDDLSDTVSLLIKKGKVRK